MKSMVTNENVNMYSNGKPTRSFIYITDAIVGYILALNKAFNVYNIGNDQKKFRTTT